MKKLTIKLIACYLLLQLSGFQTRAQEVVQGLKQKFDITIDELGNANIEVSMKLNAERWENFKRNTGNNQSIMKRDIEKSLPKHYLTDFAYSEDAMERTYTIKMKALGLCKLNKDGKWQADIEAKNPDITKLSDNEFVMNEDVLTSGVLVQQTQKLHLPSGASGAKVEKDSFGMAIVTYKTGLGWGHKLANYLGIGLLLAGAGLFFKGFMDRKKQAEPVNPA
ncbi:MAG: hypothetical protein JO301_06460 [Chitinophagaceae bacterium]|nr:hypothetical protein [Chitinophagaceae bacterium]